MSDVRPKYVTAPAHYKNLSFVGKDDTFGITTDREHFWEEFKFFYNENAKTIERSTAADVEKMAKAKKGKDLDVTINTFIDTTHVVLKGLAVLGQAHPVLNMAISAFHGVLKLEIARRENDKKVLAVQLQMQNMMCAMFQLRKLDFAHVVEKERELEASGLQTLITIIAEEIKQCGSDLNYYVGRRYIARLVNSSSYNERLASHVEIFAQRRSELQATIAGYIAGGIDAANIAIARVGEKVQVTNDKIDFIVGIFHQLRTAREQEAWDFMEQNGGPKNCVEKDDLLAKLLTKANEPASGAGVISRGEDIGGIKEMLLVELEQVLDDVLAQNFARFEKLLKVQESNLKRISDQIEVQGHNQGVKLDSILRHLTLESDKRLVIKDEVLQHIWNEMGWKGTVKAKHLVLTLRDHLLSRLVPSAPGTPYNNNRPALLPLTDEHQDNHNSQDLKVPKAQISPARLWNAEGEDLWALQYLDASHVQPVIEAMDHDGSGFISVKEANTFAIARPNGWSLLRLIAYWATGWHINITSYRSRIYSIVQQMHEALLSAHPANRSYVDEYLNHPCINRVEALLRSTTPLPDNARKDSELMDAAAFMVKLQEEHLTANLTTMSFLVDSSADVILVAGRERVETWILPLLYLILNRHLDVIKLARKRVLHAKELTSHAKSLASIFSVFDERMQNLETIFRHVHRDIVAQFKNFAYGMFYTAFAQTENYPSKNTLLTFKDNTISVNKVKEPTFLALLGYEDADSDDSDSDADVWRVIANDDTDEEEVQEVSANGNKDENGEGEKATEGQEDVIGAYNLEEGAEHRQDVDRKTKLQLEELEDPEGSPGPLQELAVVPSLQFPEPDLSRPVQSPEQLENPLISAVLPTQSLDPKTLEVYHIGKLATTDEFLNSLKLGDNSEETGLELSEVPQLPETTLQHHDSGTETPPKSDTPSPVTKAAEELSILSIGLGETLEFEEVDIKARAAPEGHIPHSLEGVWTGQCLRANTKWIAFQGFFECDIGPITDNYITGKGETYSGKVSIDGKVIEQNKDDKNTQVDFVISDPTDVYASLRCKGQYNAKNEVIKGQWATVRSYYAERFPPANDEEGEKEMDRTWPCGWFSMTRTPASVFRFRQLLHGPASNPEWTLARRRWVFATQAVHFQTAAQMNSANFFRERTAERRRWVELTIRRELDKVSPVPPTKMQLPVEKMEELWSLRLRMHPTNGRLYDKLAIYLFKRNSFNVGPYKCKSCNRRIIFGRFQCITCMDDTMSSQLDLCGDCIDAPNLPDDGEFVHHISHSLIRSTHRIHNCELASMIPQARLRSARIKAAFKLSQPESVSENEHDQIGLFLSLLRASSFSCACCDKDITLPCWVCVSCAQDTFICLECDLKRRPVLKRYRFSAGHSYDHPLLRFHDSDEVKANEVQASRVEKKLAEMEKRIKDSISSYHETFLQQVRDTVTPHITSSPAEIKTELIPPATESPNPDTSQTDPSLMADCLVPLAASPGPLPASGEPPILEETPAETVPQEVGTPVNIAPQLLEIPCIASYHGSPNLDDVPADTMLHLANSPIDILAEPLSPAVGTVSLFGQSVNALAEAATQTQTSQNDVFGAAMERRIQALETKVDIQFEAILALLRQIVPAAADSTC